MQRSLLNCLSGLALQLPVRITRNQALCGLHSRSWQYYISTTHQQPCRLWQGRAENGSCMHARLDRAGMPLDHSSVLLGDMAPCVLVLSVHSSVEGRCMAGRRTNAAIQVQGLQYSCNCGW